MLGSFIVMHCS